MSQIVMIKCQKHHMLPHLFPMFRIPLNEIHCGTFDQHCQLITFVCRSLTQDTQFEGGEPTCIVQALTTFVQMIFSIISIFGCGHPYFPPWRMAAYLAITIIPGSLLGVFFFSAAFSCFWSSTIVPLRDFTSALMSEAIRTPSSSSSCVPVLALSCDCFPKEKGQFIIQMTSWPAPRIAKQVMTRNSTSPPETEVASESIMTARREVWEANLNAWLRYRRLLTWTKIPSSQSQSIHAGISPRCFEKGPRF